MMYKEKIIDHATGKITWRDFTAEEIAKVDAEIERLKVKEKETQARQTARESALAKLAALGLTEDEIAAL